MTKQHIFKARDIGELINALPAMYGFPPEDSLVVLGLARRRIVFGVRFDLPDAAQIDAVANLAVHHLEHQQVEGAIVLAVGEPLGVGQRLVKTVEARLDRVHPVAGGWANDERYWVSMAGGDPGGYPYRRTLDHPAAAHAILAGQEISSSRAALAERVLPDEGANREWIERSADEVAHRYRSDMAGLSMAQILDGAKDEFVPIIHDLMARRPVDDSSLLRLGYALTRVEIRDALWGLITHENAREMVGGWLHVARMVPVTWTSAPLCLAAFASWLSGDGAMAVIAAERARSVDAGYSMAELMLTLATSGVSPQEWSGWSEPGPENWYRDDQAAS